MNKIIKHLKKHGAILDESIAYQPEKYPFTYEEFQEYTDKIYGEVVKGDLDNLEPYFVKGYFEEYAIPFKEGKEEFILDILYGQGSAWTLFTKDEYVKYRKRVDKLPFNKKARKKKK